MRTTRACGRATATMKKFVVGAMTGAIFLGAFGVAPAAAKPKSPQVITIHALASVFVADPVCPGAKLPADGLPNANVMTGTLDGCWYTDTADAFTPPEDNGDGTYTQVFVGTEHFVGCLHTHGKGPRNSRCGKNDPSGTWQTNFVFIATFSWATGAELAGGCLHPIIEGSGTGDFTGIRGTIHMTDNVQNGTSDVTGSVTLAT